MSEEALRDHVQVMLKIMRTVAINGLAPEPFSPMVLSVIRDCLEISKEEMQEVSAILRADIQDFKQ